VPQSRLWDVGCLVVVLLLIVGCIALWNAVTGDPQVEAADTQPSPPPIIVFTNVGDKTGRPRIFRVAGPVGTYDASVYSTSRELRINLMVLNHTATTYHPVARIEYPDGSTITCQENDFRRYPSIYQNRPYADLPCDTKIPSYDPGRAVVTVIDDY